MQDQKRKAGRARRGELLTLLNGWDPAGLLKAGGPRDGYDVLVDKLLGLLSRNASKEDVAVFLEREVIEHFGKARDASQFAAKAVAWFHMIPSERE